ncbi:hypothetical protein D7D52_27940 [Nocardia yunnanensis]|uniref:Neocarzinostatin n=1 Tax=Nocardia yunnanensis TaxID=2382165 RepID=A0A386ZGG7_9NOCA|nr:neocarzinostatin apoprotein domain-containing protein [Nocardia yunnanensis]AYF77002.1 hypothetical protein D7D52_27940 [Nocardia yunnanensis]
MRRNIFRGVAGAAVTAAALLAFAPPATAAPVLHPTPAGDVTVGEIITVALDGLPANMPTVAIGQCKAQIALPTDCNLSASLLGSADAAGVWKPGERGNTILLTASIGGVDCTTAPGACALAVTSLTNPNAILASVPLTFTTPKPSKTAAPDSDTHSSHTTAYVVGGSIVIVVLALALAVALFRRGRRT